MTSPVYGPISQGTVMRKINATANDAAKRGPFLADLKDQHLTFVQVLLNHVGLKPPEANYLLTYWFNPNIADPRIFWPDKQPIEPIVRQGLIDAIELATDKSATELKYLPTDYYWICIGDQFAAYIVKSTAQVTHFILSPHPPPGSTSAATVDANIWAVEDDSDSETPGQPAPGMTVESVHPYTVGVQVSVVTSRLKQTS